MVSLYLPLCVCVLSEVRLYLMVLDKLGDVEQKLKLLESADGRDVCTCGRDVCTCVSCF